VRVRSAGVVPDQATDVSAEWSVATRCRPGELTNGDLGVVELCHDGVLLAGIDGVGHGADAARAARRAGDIVRSESGEDLAALAMLCHAALRDTRGAALTLARLSTAKGEVTWLGIGNVEGRVISGEAPAAGPKGSLALAAGVPGHELPRIRPETLTVRPGDVLILATDGIRATFADALDVSGSTAAIAARIMRTDYRRVDDAVVVAARYLGRRA